MKQFPLLLTLALLAAAQTPIKSSARTNVDPVDLRRLDQGENKVANATELAQQSLRAMGVEPGRPPFTALVKGTLHVNGDRPLTIPVEIKSRGTTEMRTELSTPQGMRVFVVNHGRGVIRYPNGKVKWLADENMADQRVTHIPALSMLAEHGDPANKLEDLGEVTVRGVRAHAVSIASLKQGKGNSDRRTATTFYLDSSTGLPVSQERPNFSENLSGHTETLEVVFSDYRRVRGIAVPFRQQTFIGGKLFHELTIDSVEFNAAVNDSDFQLDD
jgi:hypothetical protein